MTRRPTRASVGAGLLLVGLALVGGWRWWLGPRQAAAREAAAPALIELRATTHARLAADLPGLPRFDAASLPGPALRWRPPGACVEVYRLDVDDQFRDASVAVFLGREEEHARYYLALAPDPGRRGSTTRAPSPVLGVLVGPDEPGTGPTDPRVRELWWGPSAVGPSAPDLACRRRSWDLVEDALALGWPRLPEPGDRPVRVGERWRGAAVEGRCHETVCVDTDGSFAHAVPCRARPWAEQLAGAEGTAALVLGSWDDGHDPARAEIGILTSRVAVVDEGRPLEVRATIEQRWAGVRRELALVRVDDCSARTLARPTDTAAVADTRAQLRTAIRARLPAPAAE